MANLTSGVNSPGGGTTSQNTASVTPTAGAVVTVAVMLRYDSAPASSPTVSGCGLTWTLRRTEAGAATRRLYVFTGVGTPSAGAITISRGGSDTFFQAEWKVDEFAGRNTTSPVVQSASTSYTSNVTSMTATFGGTSTSGSILYSAAFLSGGSSTPTARTNWSLISGGITGDPNIQTQERTTGTDTAGSIGWSFAGPGAIIAIELAAAPAGGPTYTLTADAGSFALTGNAAGLRASRKLAADAGTFALTGVAATLKFTRRIAADTGSFSLTGQAAGLRASRKLAADAGTFTLTGQAAGIRASRLLTAAPGAFTLTGYDASLQYSGTLGPTYTLTAEAGSFTLTGQAAALLANRRIAAAAGAFTLTGTAAGLRASRLLTAQPGSFTLTGQDAAFRRSYVLVAERGVFVLTGYPVDLDWSGAPDPITGTVILALTISPALSVGAAIEPAVRAAMNHAPAVTLSAEVGL